jgi:hypothetical protein
MVSQLGTVRIKGVNLNVASSLSCTQEVVSRVQAAEVNSAWTFQRLINKQTSVNRNSLVR